MSEFTLHCFAQSGNAYKVALMLELAKADWEPKWVDFFGGVSRDPEFRKNENVMGELPILEHGDLHLVQSGVILDYLAEVLGLYGGQTAEERREIWRWILFDNHKLTSYTATLRFQRTFVGVPENDVTAFFEKRAIAAHQVLDQHLEGKSFVVGDRLTIADFSLCGYLFWPEEIGIDFAPFANTRAWLERIKSIPSWKHPYDLMPGHPLVKA
ncbi:MAG: glutathione S-transferase family protein [Rhodobacteraceae bacterium]|nr:glutathione S-transferase family protein [Paracoccaceae bacterium]